MHITQCARAFLLYFACLSFHAPFSILSILNAFGCAYGLGFALSALDSCALTTSGHFPGEEKKKRNTQLYCPIHRHYNFSPVDFSQQNIIIIIMFFFWFLTSRLQNMFFSLFGCIPDIGIQFIDGKHFFGNRRPNCGGIVPLVCGL